MLVTGGIARSFVSFSPFSGRRWPVALEAALAMAIPLSAATLLGRTDAGLVCALGAFTALYASDLTRHARARMLPLVAAAFVAAAALGAGLAPWPVLALVGLAAVSIAAAGGAMALRLAPPGALFFPLVFGAASRIAAPPELGGAGVPAWLVIVLVACGAAVAYLVVVAPLALPRVRRAQFSGLSFRELVGLHRLSSAERRALIQVAVAVVAAAAISLPLGTYRAYWMMVAVLAVVQASRAARHSVLRGLHRVVGTMAGIGLFALIVMLHPTGFVLVALLVGLQFVTEISVVRHYALALLFITPLALTIASTASAGDPTSVALERLVDTVIGAALGALVLLIPRIRNL